MVTLFRAKSVYLGAEAVLSSLKERKGRSIIIVPDAFTLSLETGALTKLGREGTFDIEVMSFARLASLALGKDVLKCLSPAGSVMLMEKVIGKYASSLRVYGKVAKKPGFASEIYAAVTAIRNSGVSVETLEAAAGSLGGYLREKTLDVALLYKGYLEALCLEHTDSTTRLEALVEAIREGSVLSDADFYVMDHFDFNAKQLEVLSALMEKARSVSVAVADHGGSDNKRIYPSATYQKLLSAAKKAGVSVREVEVEDSLPAEKRLLAEKLFSYAYHEGKTEKIRLAQAKDPEEEVTLLATEIVRLVRKQGARYRDMAVITPSFGTYLPYLNRIFSQYDIPFFADARYPLSQCDVFDHMMTGIELVASGFERAKVSKYVSHFLFEEDAETKALFDDYVMKYGVDRTYFLEPFRFGEEEAAATEEMRLRLVKELLPFLEMKKEDEVRAYAASIRRYLAENAFDEKITAYAKKLYEDGYLQEQNVIAQAPQKITELLATLEEIRGEDVLTREDLVFALRAGAEQVKIASLPVSLDCVYFAPVEQAMYEPIPYLFLLGAEEGLFPLEILKEGVLGEREYTAWQKLDIVIEDTGAEELSESRFHALQLLLRPENLRMSCSVSPSSAMKQLADMYDLPMEKAGEMLSSDYAIDELIPTPCVAENYLTEYSRKEREGLLTARERGFAEAIADVLGRDFPLPVYDEMPDVVPSECFFRSKETSVSEIESYYHCPFSHFVRYGLNAKERDVAETERADLGNIVHACVCAFTKDPAFLKLNDEAAEKKAREIAAKELSAPQYQTLIRREGRQLADRFTEAVVSAIMVVREQIGRSTFVPTFFEKNFGVGHFLPAVDLGEIKLRGKIDRVDVLEGLVAAIDYKTGQADVKIRDLYYGKKVQLELYLAVLREKGYRPAAAFYFDLGGGYKKQDATYMKGHVLKEPFVVLGLDGKSAKEKSDFTGLVMKDSGSVKEESDLTLEAQELEMLIDYALLVAKRAVEEIHAGYIAPSPLEERDCSYCKERNICHFAGMYERKKSDAVHIGEIAKIMSEEDPKC
ncbi:MAG: PD-(D/E)XK nuclease family protein [Clostridia bacterium]|nr:PD-(D/E)XK nuclease family protein [Clostridia bacterium]